MAQVKFILSSFEFVRNKGPINALLANVDEMLSNEGNTVKRFIDADHAELPLEKGEYVVCRDGKLIATDDGFEPTDDNSDFPAYDTDAVEVWFAENEGWKAPLYIPLLSNDNTPEDIGLVGKQVFVTPLTAAELDKADDNGWVAGPASGIGDQFDLNYNHLIRSRDGVLFDAELTRVCDNNRAAELLAAYDTGTPAKSPDIDSDAA